MNVFSFFQVNSACVENLDGIHPGIKWLLTSCSWRKKNARLMGRRQNENFSFYNEVIMDYNIAVK